MAGNSFTSNGGDTLIAQQYADTFRRSEHLEPEKALLTAILDDAVHEYRKYLRKRDANGKKRFREAEDWIMHGSNDWILSFDNVCDFLGLNAENVRLRLGETKDKRAKEKPEKGNGLPGKAKAHRAIAARHRTAAWRSAMPVTVSDKQDGAWAFNSGL
jgi:hypothetical protein